MMGAGILSLLVINLQADAKIVPKFRDLFPLMSQVYAIWIDRN
jgi:hypothetical protein